MSGSDKRELRVSLDRGRTPVAFEILAGEQPLPGGLRVANISRSGMFLECAGASSVNLDAAVSFTMRVADGDGDVRGVGKIRWVRSAELGPYLPRGFGLQVVQFHDNAEKRYLEFLEACLLQLRITDLMEPNYLHVPPDVQITDAIQMLNEHKADCLIVIGSEGEPLGTFTGADLIRICRSSDYLRDTISQHMSPGPLTLATTNGTDDAYQIMRNGTLMYIPVVENGVTVGLLQTRDLVRYWSEFMDLQATRLARNYDRAMSVIAHDLRTPLGVIQTTNAMLTSGEISPAEYVSGSFPEIIHSSSEMMLGLIDDILDVQRIKVGAVRLSQQLVNLEELAKKVVRAFQSLAQGKHITLDLVLSGPVPVINADPLRLAQVLNNLLSNALKFTPEGGKVVLGLQTLQGHVAIWVSDTGPGIPVHEVQNLFKEYPKISSRPTKGEKSNGLGLAITKRLVEAHAGTIAVTSQPGLGTTFTLTLPISGMLHLERAAG